jgi:integrase
MRLAHHLVRPRNGIYYFRQRVPTELVPVLGVRFVQHSLRTRDCHAAKVYSYTLSLRYAQAFAALRGAVLPKPPPSIDDILKSDRAGGARRFEMDLDPESVRPTRIKTDGTEHDNRAALEALRLLAQTALPPMAAPTPAPAVVPVPAATPAAPKPAGLSLAAAIQLYTESESPTLNQNTWSQRQRAFESLKATLGGATAVSTITREQAGDWAHALITRVPSDGGNPMTKRTAANTVSHAAQLFVFLAKRGKFEGTNPIKGVVVMSKKEKAARRAAGFRWEPFELDALQRVFDPINLSKIGTEHTRWALLIGLYTGARVGEVAQLYLRDFVKEGDAPCVRFTTDSDGETVKTEASKRLVPLHPDLIELGLWERVERLREAGEERLFPGMRIDSKAGTGNAISKGFGHYLKQLMIGPRRANGTVGFHSLRKTVIQTLQASGLSAERRRAFVGHEQGDADVHAMDYMRPWNAQELSALFPGLTWRIWLRVDALAPLLAPCDARLRSQPVRRKSG